MKKLIGSTDCTSALVAALHTSMEMMTDLFTVGASLQHGAVLPVMKI